MIYAIIEILLSVFLWVFLFILFLGIYRFATTKRADLNGKHVMVSLLTFSITSTTHLFKNANENSLLTGNFCSICYNF